MLGLSWRWISVKSQIKQKTDINYSLGGRVVDLGGNPYFKQYISFGMAMVLPI